MNTNVTRDGLVKILVITAVLVFTYMASYPFLPAARQRRRLAIAREHATLLTPKIRADPRFKHVQLTAYTGGAGAGGMFWVVGNVSSQADLNALRKIVEDSDPPIESKWTVEIWQPFPDEDAASNSPPSTVSGDSR